ncbi:hypothetical protein [Micromonospora sp. WMMD812]|uniref:hypothetical protein n=1 Tax=Micromonospora sp. WMMD812 TaxID=3015152 RepID=UPI00248AF40F|nr:hypothetical protein [Micromonospora sp. WMMD812]WBB70423.1 hypothetical protein O7603_14150 [Micromonospora sp. WMMD812]
MTADWLEVTRLDLSGLVTWLRSPEPGDVRWTGNEWLGVLKVFTMRLTQRAPDVAAGELAACSAAYDIVLDRTLRADGIDAREAAVRRILLTAVVLDHVPAEPAVPLRDPRVALAAFRAALPMSAAEAVEMAPRWRELDPDEMRRLWRAAGLVTSVRALRPHLTSADPESRAVLHDLAIWEEQVLPHLRGERPAP